MKRTFSSFCFFIILCLTLLSSCSESVSDPVLRGSYDTYTASVLAENSQYTLDTFTGKEFYNPFMDIQRGSVVEALDVQVMEAVEEEIIPHFLPQCLSTVVIVVDQDRTSFRPEGWKDLLVNDVEVSFPDTHLFQRLALGALAYGLEGEQYTSRSAIDYLKALKSSDRLILSDELHPVMICMDLQAARWIEEGHHLKIIIPEEGTFSYALGLLSEKPVKGASERMLLKNGLRLIDGKTINQAYPSKDKYAPAVQVSDFFRFTLETQNATREIRREVEGVRMYSFADGRETILFTNIIIIITVIWAASALYRVTQKVIRKLIFLVSFMIIGWLSVALLKYQLPVSLLTRLLWYSYYIFLIGLPLIMLYTAVIIDHPDQYRKVPRWFIPFLVLYPVLVLLVMTNDLHQLVFRFDLQGNWSDDYTYQIFYYFIFL